MKREIKFRGLHGDKWVLGSLIVINDFYRIADNDPMITTFSVKKESVGQFTGLLDKNGKEIYEGDFVQHSAWDYPFEVFFNQPRARFVCKMKSGFNQHIDYENVKVIGNIHENPELLK